MNWYFFLMLIVSSFLVTRVEGQSGFFSFLGNLFRRASSSSSSSTSTKSIITAGVFGTPYAVTSTGYVTTTSTETAILWETTTETLEPTTVTETVYDVTTAYETVTERLIATVTTTRKMTATPACPTPTMTTDVTSNELRRISWKQIPNRIDQYAMRPSNIIALENSAAYVPYIVKRSIDIESSSSSVEEQQQPSTSLD